MRTKMAIYHIVRAPNQENGRPTIFDLLTARVKIYKFLFSFISLRASRVENFSSRSRVEFLSIKRLVND